MALTIFHKVHVVASLDEGILKSDSGEPVDVVVLSYRFSEADVVQFITNAKKNPRGKDWAYISVLKSANQKNDVIADSVINGIDGFLFEPYSADNLREMAEITAKVKLQNEMNRKRTAMMLILQEVSEHLDAVTYYMSQKRDPAPALKKLREAAQRLTKFDPKAKDVYIDLAVQFFGNVPPPLNAQYTGVSQRVRQRLAAKAAKKLEGKYGS